MPASVASKALKIGWQQHGRCHRRLQTYLEAEATAPDTALHEAEKRLHEIETKLDAIAAELADEEIRN